MVGGRAMGRFGRARGKVLWLCPRGAPENEYSRCIRFPCRGGWGLRDFRWRGSQSLVLIRIPHGERQKHNQKCSSKKKDTMVLCKLFWLEHFQLGSWRIRGPPFLRGLLANQPCPARILGAHLIIIG